MYIYIYIIEREREKSIINNSNSSNNDNKHNNMCYIVASPGRAARRAPRQATPRGLVRVCYHFDNLRFGKLQQKKEHIYFMFEICSCLFV